MSVRRRLLGVALLLALSFGLKISTAPDPQPEPIGQFEGGHLEVGEGRLIPGAGEAAPGSDVDWDALWAAYLAGRVQACRDSATGPLAAARCDVIVVDNRPGSAAAVAPITISDLAQFRPLVGELVVEPDGWGVVGTPTNFYATAETHTMDGELFDAPIEVRWTPSSYRFNYGDGTVEESSASGSAWNGPDESWTETTTSHTYADREDVTASVTVIFTAEVDTGAGWFAVLGSLPVDAPSVSVKLFDVETVLTNGDCMANPSAPGCG